MNELGTKRSIEERLFGTPNQEGELSKINRKLNELEEANRSINAYADLLGERIAKNEKSIGYLTKQINRVDNKDLDKLPIHNPLNYKVHKFAPKDKKSFWDRFK